MKLVKGEKATPIMLPEVNGGTFNTESLKGKPYMLSFFRFASCPFCNMRVHQLVTQFDEFGADFTIVAIFDSSVENLARHAQKHQAPFPILADQANKYYEAYQIEHSIWGMLKGMITRFTTLMKGVLKGYIPFPIKGSLTTMPAEFLIDRNGVIQKAYYAKDEGDHLDMKTVVAFAQS